MDVECYIGALDETWYRRTVRIPSDTAETDIERVAIETMASLLDDEDTEVAFIGVYYIDRNSVEG